MLPWQKDLEFQLSFSFGQLNPTLLLHQMYPFHSLLFFSNQSEGEEEAMGSDRTTEQRDFKGHNLHAYFSLTQIICNAQLRLDLGLNAQFFFGVLYMGRVQMLWTESRFY
jgi:hypothetical protein